MSDTKISDALPALWGVRIGDSDTWGYVEVESDADFIGRKSGLSYEKRPFYLHPQPAELAEQQVGEVQGDALPPMPKCHDRQPDDMPGYMESALDWARDPDNCEAVEWLMENHAAIRADLAARQPGAHGPKFTTEDGPCWHHAGKAFIVTVDGDNLQLMVTDGPRIEFIGDARPFRVPAQGIDLGQIVRECCEAEVADPDHEDTICISVSDLTAIIAQHSQRYAAPGVGVK